MSTFYDQTPTFRKIGRFFTWRQVRRFLLVSVSLITVVAVYYTEEDWRGRRDWDAYIKELEAQGIPVTQAEVDKFAAPPVPDDQNFWKAPYLKEITQGSYLDMSHKLSDRFGLYTIRGKNWDHNSYYDNLGSSMTFMNSAMMGMSNDVAQYDGTGNLVDIPAWQKALDQPDLLAAIRKFEPELDEISTACKRPFIRPPPGYSTSLWPSSFNYQEGDLGIIYELRGVAELNAGQTDRAADDAITLLGSCDPITGWRLFDASEGLQLLWQGLVAHQWKDGQLVAIQAALQKVDYFPLLIQRHSEQPSAINVVDGMLPFLSHQADTVQRQSSPFTLMHWWFPLKVAIYPKGRIYQKCLELVQNYEAMLATCDVSNRRLDGVKLLAQSEFFEKNNPEIHEHIMTIAGFFADSQERELSYFKLQVNQLRVLDLAVVACGLERFRLANGELPEKLDDITPKYLTKIPHDIIGGGPLHYRRLDNGNYLLYGIGINGKDYGGKPGLDLSVDSVDFKADLVWPSLPKAK